MSRVYKSFVAPEPNCPAGMRAQTPVKIYQDLAELPATYNALFYRAQEKSFFFSLAWYRNYVRTVVDPTRSLPIFAAESGPGQPRAILMMQHRAGNRFAIRELRALGNCYTSLCGPIVGEQDVALGPLAEEIARQGWNRVDLHPLEFDSAQKITDAFHSSGLFAYRYFCFGNWYLEVKGRSYREYFETLPSALKNTLARKRKQGSKRFRIDIITGNERLEAALDAYHRVYNVSWKVPEPHPEFIRGLAAACAGAGWLRLGILYVDEEPASAQIWIVNSGIASIYKLAYDKRFARLSVGSLLTARLMEHVIDHDRVREVDYLTGDDPYKKDWMSHRRGRWGVIALNPRTFYGPLLIAKHLTGSALDGAMRSLGLRSEPPNGERGSRG